MNDMKLKDKLKNIAVKQNSIKYNNCNKEEH